MFYDIYTEEEKAADHVKKIPVCSSSRERRARNLPCATQAAASPMWALCRTVFPTLWNCPRRAITPSPLSTAPAHRRLARIWHGPSASSLNTPRSWRSIPTATPSGAVRLEREWQHISAPMVRQPLAVTICPSPGAVVMQYTGHSEYSESDPPTFACVGENDGIANWRTMQRRLDAMSAAGIDTKFHKYPGLSHGFGVGVGTVAEGWVDDAGGILGKANGGMSDEQFYFSKRHENLFWAGLCQRISGLFGQGSVPRCCWPTAAALSSAAASMTR